MTAGIATSNPNAVVTRASAIPPATAARPVAFSCEIPLKAFRMPITVPNSPTNGAVNHHAERPSRHDEENDHYSASYPSHRFPERDRIPLRSASLLKEPGGGVRNVCYQVRCCMSVNHELLFLLENLF